MRVPTASGARVDKFRCEPSSCNLEVLEAVCSSPSDGYAPTDPHEVNSDYSEH